MKTLFFSFLLFFPLINLSAQNISWIGYTPQNSGLPNENVYSIYIDEFNSKWIGTGNGLAKYNGIDWVIYNTTNSDLPSNYITCIGGDNEGKLWIGTSEGLVSFNGTDWEVFTTYNSEIPAEFVTALKTDSAGIWVGAMDFETYINGGLGYYDGSDWIIYKKENSPLPDNRIRSLNIFNNSVLWIGTVNGLAKFTNGNWNVYQQDSTALNANDDIEAISFDSQNNIWLACKAIARLIGPVNEGGLVKFDGTEWTIYTYNNSPFPQNANSINYVYVDRFDNIWSALWYQDVEIYSTWGICLARFDGNNVWNTYANKFTTFIKCISMDDSNHLWIGTLHGVNEMIDPAITKINSDNTYGRVINFELFPNHPNPFNPTTNIEFTIPNPAFVTLKVFDVLGNEIKTLVNEEKTSGRYNIKFDGSNLASGIYFYVLRTGVFIQVRKMLLIK